MEWQTEVVVPIFRGPEGVLQFLTPLGLPGKVYFRVLEKSWNKNNVDSIMDVEQRTSFGRDMRVRLTNLHMFQNGSLTV